jgi:hypothetical protein
MNQVPGPRHRALPVGNLGVHASNDVEKYLLDAARRSPPRLHVGIEQLDRLDEGRIGELDLAVNAPGRGRPARRSC